MKRLAGVHVPRWALRREYGLVITFASLAALTGMAPFLGEEEIVVITMLFLLVVLLSSASWGYVVGLAAAAIADVLLNLFFVPPLHTLTVQEPRNIAALVIFLAVAVVGGSMLSMLRRQLTVARERRAELTIMLGLSRELAAAPSPQRALDALARAVARAVQARRCEILQLSGRTWRVIASTGDGTEVSRDDAALAQAAIESGDPVRRLPERRFHQRQLGLAGHGVVDTFVPFNPPTGDPGVIHIRGTLTPPAGGDVNALLVAFADEAGVAIHHARLAEQARHAEALRESDEFKSAILSSVSHDLRSPLTAIKAAVGSLRSDGVVWSETDREELLGTIESQTDRLTTTVTDLLDMSRLDGGAIRPTIEPVDARTALQDAMAATKMATSERVIEMDALEGLWIRADYGLLLQALTNLVENAAKYSTPGGRITLGAGRKDGSVVFRVADEGPGIAASDLPHIFERFYRGGEGKRGQGTGLGLAIVRAMVELCGGRVSVESTSAGSTFELAFPPASPPQ